jgi:hypothetical protein
VLNSVCAQLHCADQKGTRAGKGGGMVKTAILIADAITLAVLANAVMFACFFAGYQICKMFF